MNQLFDLKRFGKYLAYEAKANTKTFLTFYATIFAVVLCFVFFSTLNLSNAHGDADSYSDSEKIIFTIAAVIIALYSSSIVFTQLKDKSGRINSLMLPASQLEKYISKWLLTVPLTLFVSYFIFEAIDVLNYFFIKIIHPWAKDISLVGWNPLSIHPHDFVKAIIIILFPMSTFTLGSSIWPKRGFVYTLLSNVIISVVLSNFALLLITWRFSNGFSFPQGYELPWYLENMTENALLTITCVFSLFNYVLAYFRFREIEIVQRW